MSFLLAKLGLASGVKERLLTSQYGCIATGRLRHGNYSKTRGYCLTESRQEDWDVGFRIG